LKRKLLLQHAKGGYSVRTQGVTAVILDQYPIWLDVIERMLEELGITAIGKTTHPDDALRLIRERRPDLFILDVDTNGFAPDGFACLRKASSIHPSMKTVVVSGSEDPERIDAVLGVGAMAYVLKRAEPGDLASAIRQVFARSLYFSGAFQGKAVASVEADTVGLTRREREILQFVAEGSTNGDVAKKLWVTEQTVKFHLANIFRKLEVSNRTQASRWAHEHGLLERSVLERDLIATG